MASHVRLLAALAACMHLAQVAHTADIANHESFPGGSLDVAGVEDDGGQSTAGEFLPSPSFAPGKLLAQNHDIFRALKTPPPPETNLLSPTTTKNFTNYIAIGFIHDVSKLPAFGQPMRAAAQIAVDQINENPSILPHTKLVLKEADGEAQERVAGIRTLELIQDRSLVAIVGPTLSLPAIATQYVAQLFRVPQISPTATLSVLSDKTTHPTFMRTNGGGYTHLLARFIQGMGWRQIVVLTHITHYNLLESVQFGQHARKAKLRITQQFDFKEDTVAQKLELIKTGDSRIVVLFADRAPAVKVLRAAKALGMVGPGWEWIGNDGWLRQGVNDDDTKLFVGTLGLVPRPPANKELERAWEGAKAGVGRPGTVFKPYTGFTGVPKEINWGAEATYDAVMVVGHAVNSMIQGKKNITDKTEFLKAMKTVRLTDHTGFPYLEFDQSTGDRIIDYSVVNGRTNGTLVEVGHYNVKEGFRLLSAPIYGGGEEDLPVDAETCRENYFVGNGTCRDCPPGLCSKEGLETECQPCKVETDPYDGGLRTTLQALGALSLLLSLLVAMWTFLRKDMRLVESSLPPILFIAIAGCALIFSYPIFVSINPSDPICYLRIWSRYLGTGIILAIFTVKVWPSASFLRRRRKPAGVELSTGPTLQYTCIYVAVYVIYLSFWSALRGPKVETFTYTDGDVVRSYQECHEEPLWQWAACGFSLLLWLWCALLAFSVRLSPAFFYEAFFIMFAALFAAGAYAVAIPLAVISERNDNVPGVAYATLVGVCQHVAVGLVALFLLFGPKAWQVERTLRTKKDGTLDRDEPRESDAKSNYSQDGSEPAQPVIEVEPEPEQLIADLERENAGLREKAARLHNQLLGLGNPHLITASSSPREKTSASPTASEEGGSLADSITNILVRGGNRVTTKSSQPSPKDTSRDKKQAVKSKISDISMDSALLRPRSLSDGLKPNPLVQAAKNEAGSSSSIQPKRATIAKSVSLFGKPKKDNK